MTIPELAITQAAARRWGKRMFGIAGVAAIITYDTVNVTWTGDMDSLTNQGLCNPVEPSDRSRRVAQRCQLCPLLRSRWVELLGCRLASEHDG